MPDIPDFNISNDWITSRRGSKNTVHDGIPYAYSIEKEYSAYGTIEDVITVFLTNKECPFKCLMCDLWKNTLDHKVAPGSIVQQIRYALDHLPAARQIKLYNSGNFFDPNAIPIDDYEGISDLLSGFKRVIVESHPKLINQRALEFRDMIKTDLEVAMGLETVHPEVLRKLNKRMDLDDFQNAVRFLSSEGIGTRSFILLRPPFLSEVEGVEWAKRSLEFSFDAGVECCVVIPTRPGNGAVDWLLEHGYFNRPQLISLEEVSAFGLALNRGRVFADIWDLELFSTCDTCFDSRKTRLGKMNLHQKVLPPITCDCMV